MMRENLFYKILSTIHLAFFTSLLLFSTIFLSASFMTLPGLCAVFQIGRDYLHKKIDITDSIIKKYFSYFKSSIRTMKYVGVNFILLLNVLGMLVAFESGRIIFAYLCLVIMTFLVVFLLYIAGVYTFIGKEIDCIEVIFIMFLKPLNLIPVFITVLLATIFFSKILMIVFLLFGAVLSYCLELVILLPILHYKNITGISSAQGHKIEK